MKAPKRAEVAKRVNRLVELDAYLGGITKANRIVGNHWPCHLTEEEVSALRIACVLYRRTLEDSMNA